MKFNVLFLTIFIIFVPKIINAQTFGNQNLYLKIDTLNKPREKSTTWTEVENLKQQRMFWYTYLPAEQISELNFWCLDRSLAQTVSGATLASYNVVTLEQLEAYFNTLTRQQILDYFDFKRQYFIIEKVGNDEYQIIPTVLDMMAD